MKKRMRISRIWKIGVVLALLVSGLTYVAQEVKAETPAESFQFDSATGTITKYIGTDTDVIIPSVIDTKAVTTIGSSAFSNNSTITSVTIPASVTTIEDSTANNSGAFYRCQRLVTVTILGNISRIGAYAFVECEQLTTINNTIAITSVGKEAFMICRKLKTVNLGKLTSIGESSFSSCNVLPGPIELASGVTTIPANAFAFCNALTTVTSDSATTSVGNSAFERCVELTRINLGKLTSIGERAFFACQVLLGPIELAAEVTTIPADAFYYCHALTSVTSDSATTSVGNNAFEQCVKLTTINLGKLTSIGESSFRGCKVLPGPIELASGVTTIPDKAFYECNILTTVNSDSAITVIGNSAFEQCVKLTTINLGKLTSIGTSSFGNCGTLSRTIELAVGVTSIPDRAFINCKNITTIANESPITAIGVNSFGGCNKLTAINLGKLTSIAESAFSWCSILPVPIELAAELTTIPDNAFAYCGALTTVTSEAPTISVGNNAFENCTNLTTLNLGGLTNIGTMAFKRCRVLSGPIKLASGFTSIPKEAFYECYELTSIVNDSPITAVDVEAFYVCRKLESINLQLESIGRGAFVECESLPGALVKFSSALTSIGQNAFSGCVKITEITLPNNLKTIGTRAFERCSLPYVTLPDSVTSVAAGAFDKQNSTGVYTVKNGISIYTFPPTIDVSKVTTTMAGVTIDAVNRTATSTNPLTRFQYTYTVSNSGGVEAPIGVTMTMPQVTVINAKPPNVTKDLYSTEVKVGKDTSITPLSVAATSTDGGIITYQWYSNTSNASTGGTLIAGATNTEYTPPIDTEGTTYYYCVITNTNEAVNGVTTATATTRIAMITVVVNAVAPIITNDLSTSEVKVLKGSSTSALDATATVSDGGTITYQWYSNTSNTVVGGTAIVGATSATYTPETSTAGTKYYYCEVTNNNAGATGTKTAKTTSKVAMITVVVNAAIPVITNDLNTTEVKVVKDSSTSALNATATASDGGMITYQWYSGATNVTGAGTAISGAKNATYTPSTVAEGTKYYYCVVTNTNNSATGIKTATTTSNVAMVTVVVNAETPTITRDLTTTEVKVVEGTTASALDASATVSDGGTITYQWYSGATNNIASGAVIVGATSATYPPPTNTLGTTYYYCVVTNTNSHATGTTTAKTTSKVAMITVEAKVHAVAPTITKDLSTTEVKITQDVTASALEVNATASDGGTITYQWYSGTTNVTSAGSLIGGATSTTYTPPTNTLGTKYYYCVVTNTNNSATGTKTATTTSKVAMITVEAKVHAVAPTITKDLSATEVKVTQDVTASALEVNATASDGGMITYQWYSGTTNVTSAGSLIGGATNATYTPPTNTLGTKYYYCVVTNTNNSATGSKTATTTSKVAMITVVAKVHAVAPTITKDLSEAEIKVTQGVIASALEVNAIASDGGTVTYQWYNGATNVTSAGSVIVGATSTTYTPPTNTLGTKYYYCVVTNTNNSATGTETATTTSKVAMITIEQKVNAVAPIISKDLSATEVKVTQDATATALNIVATVSDGGDVTYQWYSGATNNIASGTAIVGATSATYTPPTNTLGTMHYYCVVTNTNNSATGIKTAKTTSKLAMITVEAKVHAVAPTITKDLSAAEVKITQDVTASALEVNATSSDGGTITYQWYSGTTNVTSAGSAIVGATSTTYTPPTNTLGTTYYYCVVTNTNNSATATTTSKVAMITVEAKTDAVTPAITNDLSTTEVKVVKDASASALDASATVSDNGNVTYQWYSSASNAISDGTDIDGATNATYTPVTNAIGTTYYYCVVTNTNNYVTGNKTAKTTSKLAMITVTKKAAIMIEGQDQATYKGEEEELLFVSSADFIDFMEIQVDNQKIDASYYNAEAGSIRITLKPEYLKTLAVGEHLLSILSSSGDVETTFVIKARDVKPQDPTITPEQPSKPSKPSDTTNPTTPTETNQEVTNTSDTTMSMTGLFSMLVLAGISIIGLKRKA